MLVVRFARWSVLCHVVLIHRTVSQTNVALHKPSTGTTSDPEYATDDNLDHSSCSFLLNHSNNYLWWIVDLENLYTLQSVRMYTRSNYYLQYDFQKFYIYVSKENPFPGLEFTKGIQLPGELCLYQSSPIPSTVWNDLPCQKNVTGRFVTLWMPDFTGYVYLCEFQAISQEGPMLSVPNFFNSMISAEINWRKKSILSPFYTEKLDRACLSLCVLACLSAKSDSLAGRSTLAQLNTRSRLCQCVTISSFDPYYSYNSNYGLRFIDHQNWSVMELSTYV